MGLFLNSLVKVPWKSISLYRIRAQCILTHGENQDLAADGLLIEPLLSSLSQTECDVEAEEEENRGRRRNF